MLQVAQARGAGLSLGETWRKTQDWNLLNASLSYSSHKETFPADVHPR